MAQDDDGTPVGALPDPAGGTFDAAGNWDRLIGEVPTAPTWSSIEEYGDTVFTRSQASALLAELPQVLRLARDERERRGLARLAVLAALCESNEGLHLHFVGD